MNSGTKRVYKEEAIYSCEVGYSVDDKATGPKQFELSCKANGEYTGPGSCEPIECGDVTKPNLAEQQAIPMTRNYRAKRCT